MIYVISKLALKPGKLKVFMEGWTELVLEYRNEAGCVSYDVVKAKDNDNLCYMVSRWENEESYEQHLAGPYYRRAYDYSFGFLAKSPETDRCLVVI